jgi:hypothetical protein
MNRSGQGVDRYGQVVARWGLGGWSPPAGQISGCLRHSTDGGCEHVPSQRGTGLEHGTELCVGHGVDPRSGVGHHITVAGPPAQHGHVTDAVTWPQGRHQILVAFHPEGSVDHQETPPTDGTPPHDHGSSVDCHSRRHAIQLLQLRWRNPRRQRTVHQFVCQFAGRSVGRLVAKLLLVAKPRRHLPWIRVVVTFVTSPGFGHGSSVRTGCETTARPRSTRNTEFSLG